MSPAPRTVLAAAVAIFAIGGLACSSAEQADRIAECAGTPVPTISIEPSADGTPISFVPRRIHHPDFESWTQLEAYVTARHDRIRECANEAPDRILAAAVTLSRTKTIDEMEEFVDTYSISLSSVRYTRGDITGEAGVFPGRTLRNLEAKRGAGLEFQSFSGTATASDWLTAIEENSTIALVYADHWLDRMSGRIPQNVAFMPIPSIWEAYQRLQPPSD